MLSFGAVIRSIMFLSIRCTLVLLDDAALIALEPPTGKALSPTFRFELARAATGGLTIIMPYLSIHTNSALGDEEQTALLNAASKIVASQLGKPEDYVMASFLPATRMRFAGEESPTAYLEVNSIGVPDTIRNSLVEALTDLVAKSCKIKAERSLSC